MTSLQDLTDEQFEQVYRNAKSKKQPLKEIPNRTFGERIKEYATPNMQTPSAIAQGAYNAGTLGFAPQISSAVATPFVRWWRPDLFGEEGYFDTYKKGLELARENRANIEESNPGSSLLGNVIGAYALPFPAKTVKQAAGLGGLYGAIYGLASSDKGDINTPLNADMVIEALKGGTIGAATGGIAQALMSKFFPHKKPMDRTTAENIGLAQQFPKAPITKAELTRKNEDFLRQESAEKGRLGASNQERINEFKDIQKKGIQEHAGNLRNEIGGINSKENFQPGQIDYTTKGEAAGLSIRELQKQAIKERRAYSNLYKKSTEGIATVNGKDIEQLPSILEKDFLGKGLTTDNVPKVFGEINALKKVLNKKPTEEKVSSVLDQYGNKIIKEPSSKPKINVSEIQAWQQGLNRAIKEAKVGGQEEYALKQLSRKVEGYMDGLFEKALVEGDTVALAEFKQAKLMASKWFEKYQAKDNSEFGKKFIEDIIDNVRFSREPYSDEMLVNKIFGASEMGFAPQAANIIKELRSLTTDRQFNAFKLEAAQKLISPLLLDNPNPTMYLKNLKKFIKNNPTLVKQLFSGSEIQDLINLGKHGKNIFTRPVSSMNSSGTANVLIDHLNQGKLKKLSTFIKNLGNKIELDQEKIKNGLQKGEKIPKKLPATIKAAIIGNESIITDLSFKKNLQSLSDEQFERLRAKREK